MTDVLIYATNIERLRSGKALKWHSNHRVFSDLRAGDRLWVVASGRSLGRQDQSAGYLVAVWPVQQVVPNPGDDPDYPARKFGHRILIDQIEALHLDPPVCIDGIIRGNGFAKSVSIGRFMRGPRPFTDEKVRELRSAAGGEMAQKWLLGNRSRFDKRNKKGNKVTA